jgi:Protein of unknown function (DUF433)
VAIGPALLEPGFQCSRRLCCTKAVLHKEGLSAAEIVKEYDFLSLAQVYAALAYYYANQEEIEMYLVEELTAYQHLAIATDIDLLPTADRSPTFLEKSEI